MRLWWRNSGWIRFDTLTAIKLVFMKERTSEKQAVPHSVRQLLFSRYYLEADWKDDKRDFFFKESCPLFSPHVKRVLQQQGSCHCLVAPGKIGKS